MSTSSLPADRNPAVDASHRNVNLGSPSTLLNVAVDNPCSASTDTVATVAQRRPKRSASAKKNSGKSLRGGRYVVRKQSSESRCSEREKANAVDCVMPGHSDSTLLSDDGVEVEHFSAKEVKRKRPIRLHSVTDCGAGQCEQLSADAFSDRPTETFCNGVAETFSDRPTETFSDDRPTDTFCNAQNDTFNWQFIKQKQFANTHNRRKDGPAFGSTNSTTISIV